MNKYIVSTTMIYGEFLRYDQQAPDWYKQGGFPPGTFTNSGAEISPEDANELRARLRDSLRNREPQVIPPQQVMFEVEADFYSVSAEGTAMFYRKPPADHDVMDHKDRLVASISKPFVIRLKEEPTGSGGVGKIPWTPWKPDPWRAELLDSLVKATSRLKILEKHLEAIKDKADSEIPPEVKTPEIIPDTFTVKVRHWNKDHSAVMHTDHKFKNLGYGLFFIDTIP